MFNTVFVSISLAMGQIFWLPANEVEGFFEVSLPTWPLPMTWMQLPGTTKTVAGYRLQVHSAKGLALSPRELIVSFAEFDQGEYELVIIAEPCPESEGHRDAHIDSVVTGF